MPTLVSARFIGSAAARAIEADPTSATVHSLFDRALNLTTAAGTLVAIVRADAARGPLALVTDLPAARRLTALGITPGAAARREGSYLDIGGRLRVALAGAEVWRARIDLRAPVAGEAALQANRAAAREALLRRGRAGGLLPLAGQMVWLASGVNSPPAAATGFVRAAARCIAGLAGAVRSGDAAQTGAAVRGLIGLGPGATPSGDDFLIGLLAALWGAPGEHGLMAQTVAHAVTAELPGRTTWFSEQWLRCAARGEVAEPVADAVEAALTASTSRRVADAFRRLCDMGETSGTDTAVGVALGIELA